jgi:hypothetical protein
LLSFFNNRHYAPLIFAVMAPATSVVNGRMKKE